ncbi:MAG: hypothetical protein ACK56I_33975, partial [bacterium]
MDLFADCSKEARRGRHVHAGCGKYSAGSRYPYTNTCFCQRCTFLVIVRHSNHGTWHCACSTIRP